MSAVDAAEVSVGLVVHLDTGVLRQIGGCKTNADRWPVDRAVADPHYFLVVSVDQVNANATAVPLFSKPAPGSERLIESKKAGLPAKWRGEDSYFSHFQFWTIPTSSFTAASVDEESAPSNRRRYASGESAIFAGIHTWIAKNRNQFTAV